LGATKEENLLGGKTNLWNIPSKKEDKTGREEEGGAIGKKKKEPKKSTLRAIRISTGRKVKKE